MSKRERERIIANLKKLTAALHDTPEDFDAAWDAILAIGRIARYGGVAETVTHAATGRGV